MDKGEVTALTFIDLSAAFKTIDHASDRYRISEQAEIWFPFLNARFKTSDQLRYYVSFQRITSE